MVSLNNADERWQTCRLDYILDNIVVKIVKPNYSEAKEFINAMYPTAEQLLKEKS